MRAAVAQVSSSLQPRPPSIAIALQSTNAISSVKSRSGRLGRIRRASSTGSTGAGAPSPAASKLAMRTVSTLVGSEDLTVWIAAEV